ncbi:Protein-export membrane protein SecF [Streptomyces alboniger]
MSKLGNLGARLHRGEVGYDFVGNRKIWYGISILITIVAIVGLAVRGLNMGIEFQGGAVFTTPKNTAVSVAQAETYAEEASGHDAIVQKLGNGSLRIQVAGIDTGKADQVSTELARELKVSENDVTAELVGPSWGEQIANKAWQGLAIFLVLVVIYLAIAFEWRMAIAAFVALIHDITITVGIYALVGFEVTPGTVIGLLTILGYSLYDTVVVFDSLKEQTKDITKQTRWTYSDVANRSVLAQARRPPAQHAHHALPQAREAGEEGARDAGDLRAARSSPGHEHHQVGTGGPRVRDPLPQDVRRDRAAGGRAGAEA